MDKVTAILCNYNHHEYIESAFQSLLNQTYENLDIIVYDDGSDVNPQDLLSGIDTLGRKVTYMSNEQNMGKWYCLNSAIAQSTSPWIMVQDADDYAFPWKASTQLRALKETNTTLNIAGYVSIEKTKSHYIPPVPNLNDLNVIIGEEIMQHTFISITHPQINHNSTGRYLLHNGATMFHSGFHDVGVRFHPPDVGLRLAKSEDSDYNIRVSSQFRQTSWLLIPCYSYRIGSGHPEGSF
tara:strand:+ start:585 stop:1298 length:714 start_codon:yes stop_codon:yes gene_type:complete